MDFDDLTRTLGQFGKYQIILYFLVGSYAVGPSFNNMGIVFIAGVPKHWCASPELHHLNLTDDVIKNVTSASSCSRLSANYSTWTLSDVEEALVSGERNGTMESCEHGYIYDRSVYTETIVSEWDLVCNDKWLQATAASVYMAGLMCGVLIIGSVSDIVGRKPALIATVIGSLTLSISVSFSPNYIAFCVIRFFAGFCTIAMYTTGFVVVMELIGPDYRMHCGIAYQYFWSAGYLFYDLLAYYLRDWSTLNLVASCLLIPIAITLFFVPESPRWLYLHGKDEKAEAIVRKIAKTNKIELPLKLEVTVQKTGRGFFWDLCRSRRMALKSVNIFFNWFVNSCVYYGLSLNTSNLGGNDFVNFALGGAVEVPAYIICMLALHYGGRRWPLCSTMVIGGVALLLILAVPERLNWLIITLSMVGKLCISASFAIIYVFTAELYPTVVRNVGVGSGSFFARIGGVVAPYIAQLSDFNKIIPMIVFGALSLAAGLLALALPETKDKHLPETLEDGENFGRKGYEAGKENYAFEKEEKQPEFTKL